jgi:hypothetical protein
VDVIGFARNMLRRRGFSMSAAVRQFTLELRSNRRIASHSGTATSAAMIAARKETEAALGAKFSQLRFLDFVLGQGLLTPSPLRKAVLDEFVPSQL